jgi:hypothetical protein
VDKNQVDGETGGGGAVCQGWDCVSINSIQSYENRDLVPVLCSGTCAIMRTH